MEITSVLFVISYFVKEISRSMAGKIGSTILFRSFVRESAYIIYSTFISIVLLLSTNLTAEMLSVITGRTSASSSHRFTRITVISDKDHNNFHRQRCKKRDEESLRLLQILRWSGRSEDAPKLSRLAHFKTLRRSSRGGDSDEQAETIRILLKFHYDLLASSILRVSSCRACWRNGAFPDRNLCASVNGRGRPANEMINWSFLSFPARFTDARSGHFSPFVFPDGNRTPRTRSVRFALQRIVHVGPGRTLHTDYPGVIAGTKGLHANRTAGRSLPRRQGVEGMAEGRVKSAVLMLSIPSA